MPFYTYKCTNILCEHEFTIESGMNEQHDNKCPECGAFGKRIYKPITSIWNCKGSYNRDNRG